jgi:hypothetical protein
MTRACADDKRKKEIEEEEEVAAERNNEKFNFLTLLTTALSGIRTC